MQHTEERLQVLCPTEDEQDFNRESMESDLFRDIYEVSEAFSNFSHC